MDSTYILQVANDAKRQLVTLTPTNVLMSWGIEKFYATVFRGMPCLTFRVNGRLHKGEVLIALNPSDYYEVYLRNENGTHLVNDSVGWEELGEVIDVAIEKGTDEAAYQAFCMEQKRKLFSGQFF